jgi:hypothetical protein
VADSGSAVEVTEKKVGMGKAVRKVRKKDPVF